MRRWFWSMLAAAALPAAAQTAPMPDCEFVAGEIVRAEESRRQAADDAANAWKAVVPFVVLARKVNAKSALGGAEQRLAELRAQQALRCEGPRDAP